MVMGLESARVQEASGRWAPWWVYVVVIAPVNLVKEQLLAETAWPLRAALTAVIVVAGIALVTAIHRAGREGGRQPW
jgi:hypothetical protein